jgi:hypothetical protein
VGAMGIRPSTVEMAVSMLSSGEGPGAFPLVHVAGQLGSSSIRESPFARSEYTHSIDQIA